MKVKKLTKIVTASVMLAAVALSGCAQKQQTAYDIVTNMPTEYYTVTDKSFKPDTAVEGLTFSKDSASADTKGHKSGYRYWYTMYTYAQLTVYYPDSEAEDEKFNSFSLAVKEELDRVGNALSNAVVDSDVNKFNNAAAGEKVELSYTGYTILSYALEMHDFTEGYYNPALYYNIIAYGFGSRQMVPEQASALPSDEEIAAYTSIAQHFGEILLEEEDGKYYATKPQYTAQWNGHTLSLKIDLGGIGKGYAVDMVEKLFDEYGYTAGIFNFGSSSMLLKCSANGGDWNLGLSNPRSHTNPEYVNIGIRNVKLSSSGDYEQYYMLDGVRYCHIFDITTGKPVQTGIMSATVIGGNAAQSDALTTALMAMGKQRATSFIESKLKDRIAIFTVCP